MSEVAPTTEVQHPSGIEIRYFAEDKEAKVKRHYEIRKGQDWQEVPNVTSVLGILQKEQLISWAQRVGVGGAVSLFNIGALKPVNVNGQIVLGAFMPERGGWVAVDEWMGVELLKSHSLTTNALKKEGGDRGQSCHDALESWSDTGILPEPSHYPMHEQGYVSALRDFLKDSGAVSVRAEVAVGSLEHGYAGRFDNDLRLPAGAFLWTHRTEKGRGDQQTTFPAGLYRVDLKTSKGAFPEHGEQLEAYERAAIECGLPETLQRCVISCRENGQYTFVPVGSGYPRIKQYPWATFEDFERTLAKFKALESRKGRRKEELSATD